MRTTSFLIVLVMSSFCFGGEYDDIFSKPEEIKTYEGKTLMDLVPQLEENLNNAEFLYNYAWLAKEEGDLETAVNYIEKATALKPQNPFLHFKAGQIYLARGDKVNAQKHLEKALENEYEYLDAWYELVKIAPEYYYNLAQLFGEKAHQKSRSDLADEAIGYYRQYIDRNPSGEFVEKARAGIRDMELLKSEISSREKIREQQERQQRELAEQRLAREKEKIEFRTTRRRVVGLFFTTFTPSDNYLFNVNSEKREHYITKRIYLKDIPGGYVKSEYDTVDALGATSLSEFSIGGGYFVGPFIFRGCILFGRSNLKRTYLRDTTITYKPSVVDTVTVVDDSTYYPGDTIWVERISPDNVTISSVNTLRFGFEGLYNFYYANPILFYLSAGTDVGYVSLSEEEPSFESNWIYGFGVGGGAMIRFSNFLVDIGYRYNFFGSSSGGLLMIGGMVKF